MSKELQGSWKAQAVAFDMDGLMFETESVYYRAAETLLSRRGYHYTQSLCDEVMGRPPEYCFRRFIEVFSLPEDWRALQKESEDIFIELLKDGYWTNSTNAVCRAAFARPARVEWRRKFSKRTARWVESTSC